MPHFFVFLLLAMLAALGGTREETAPPPTAPDTLLTLPMGVPVAVDGADMTLTFAAVLADGRCPAQLLEGSDQPIMMQCTVSLPVEVAIAVRRGDTVERLTFRADTDTLGNVTADVAGTTPVQRSSGFIIAVEQVLPYPMVDVVRDDTAYTVTVRVTRAGGEGPVTAAPASIPARLGEPVTLAISQTAVFQPSGVQVAVAGVTDDRCPALTPCNEIAIVVVELEVTMDAETTRVSVGGVTDASGRVTGPLMETRGIPWAQVGDYAIELIAVTPYPQPGSDTDPADFAVTFVVRAREQRQPKPAASPTPASALPVLAFDASGYPLLCVSERALVDLAAGVGDAPPVASTPLPVGAVSLVSAAAGDEICAMFFGDAMRGATLSDLTMSFAAYLPPAGTFWVWDADADAAVPWEAGQ